MKENTYLRAYLNEQAANKKAAQVKPKTSKKEVKAPKEAPKTTVTEIEGQMEINEIAPAPATMEMKEEVVIKSAKKSFKKKESK